MIDDVPRLSPAAREAVEDEQNRVLLNTASPWELAIKLGLGKLSFSVPLDRLLDVDLDTLGVELVPVRPADLVRVMPCPSTTVTRSTA